MTGWCRKSSTHYGSLATDEPVYAVEAVPLASSATAGRPRHQFVSLA